MLRKGSSEILIKKRKKINLGDIYEIPLPNGKNAYGRLYKEYVLGIYNKKCKNYTEISNDETYMFFVGVYKDLLLDGKWKIVGNRKFNSEDESWAPPQCIVDAITKRGSIYYKGNIIQCSYDECKDLEVAAAWDRNHLIDRLMGNDKWEKSLGRPEKQRT